MNPAYLSPLANHLWQSSLFAAITGLLTLFLRNNRARSRHWVWLAASWKFLIPFSVLISLGSQIHWRTAPQTARSSFPAVIDQVSKILSLPAASLVPMPTARLVSVLAASLLPAFLSATWACGFLGIGCSWWIRWRRIRAVVRAGSPVHLEIPIRAVSSPALVEPGVFGVFRPIILLPEGIDNRLTAAQLRSVIAHEICHVDHWDNLLAAIHMFVETVFWFHPLVWWIGKRMVEERERACDEEVLRLGSEPRIYAEGILEVCKTYVESPLVCVSGVAGANLRKRIEAIMRNHVGVRLSPAKKAVLSVAGALALTAPIGVGIVNAPAIRAQSASAIETKSFEVASVKRLLQPSPGVSTGGGPGTSDPGRWWRSNVTLASLLVEGFHIQGHALVGPDWLGSTRYEIAAKVPAGANRDDVRLMLQRLITERFGLTFHREPKEMPAYALITGRNGPKLKPSTDSPASVPGRGGFPDLPEGVAPGVIHVDSVDYVHRLVAGAMSMAQFADYLAGQSDFPVIDLTELRGKYDIVFYYSRAPTSMNSREPADTGLDLRSALREQLGLELQTRKARVDVLVIDHIEQTPSPN